MTATKQRGRGQPTKYKAEFAERAEKLCKLGMTDDELGMFFEVDERTINNWKHAHPKFCGALKRGKLIADANVADRLYQKAMGYSHESEKIFCHQGAVTRVATVEHYPPDTTAAIFWLKNRQTAHWRDKKEVESPPKRSVHEFTDAELMQIIQDGLSENAAPNSTPPRSGRSH